MYLNGKLRYIRYYVHDKKKTFLRSSACTKYYIDDRRARFLDFYSIQSIESLIRKLFASDVAYCPRGIWFRAKQDRPDLPDSGFFSYRRIVRRNVQLDQFSNISGQDNVQGMCDRCGAGAKDPALQRNLPFDSNVSQRKGFIADISVRVLFFLSFRSSCLAVDFFPSFFARRAKDFPSPIRIKTTQLPTSRHADGKVTTGSATDVH